MRSIGPLPPTSPRILAGLVLCLAVPLATGCTLFTGPDGERGSVRAVLRIAGGPSWSPDGSEIYYTDHPPGSAVAFNLRALNVRSGRTRRLASVSGRNTGASQVRSTDAAFVLFAVGNPDNGPGDYRIFRAALEGGEASLVIADAARPWFVASPAGSRIAYTGPDTFSRMIQVVDVADPQAPLASLPTASIPGLKGFSPDGKSLVYGDSEGIFLARFDGSPPELLLPPPTGPREFAHVMAEQIFWDGDVPHLLIADLREEDGEPISTVYDVDGSTGERTQLAELTGVLATPKDIARSPDGLAFAVWVPIRVVGQAWERTVYRYQLRIQTAPGGAVSTVLSRDSSESLRWLEFSPAGDLLGFDLFATTYLLDVPGS